jgi:hypothetical protein
MVDVIYILIINGLELFLHLTRNSIQKCFVTCKSSKAKQSKAKQKIAIVAKSIDFFLAITNQKVMIRIILYPLMEVARFLQSNVWFQELKRSSCF